MQQYTTGPSLTNINRISRMVVKIGLVFLVVMIVGKMGIEAFIAYWKAIHPEPPPPPTAGFGVLPKLAFPLQLPEDKPTSYSLEIRNNAFPIFPDRAKVYFMVQQTPSLLADARAREIAKRLRFTAEPEVLDEKNYRWMRSDQDLIATFELDITQLHFSIKTDFLSRPNLILNKDLPTNFDAVNTVRQYLSQGGLLPTDATAPGVIEYTKVIGGDLQEAVSLSDADYLTVHLNRSSIDGLYPMYTEAGRTGTITAIVSSNKQYNQGIMQLSYNHFTVDYLLMHTYPLRSPETAWQLLKAGEGYVVGKPQSGVATVREVTLGYFDATQAFQQYLQPIYVFTGDDGFIGYVPAIEARFIGN